MKLKSLLLLASGGLGSLLHAQESVVTFNPNIQRFLGEQQVSELDRSIYFNLHSGVNYSDKDVSSFLRDYGVGYGRQFWGPFSYGFSKTKEVGVYPTFNKDSETGLRPVVRTIATEHPNLNVVKYGSVDPVEAGQWASDYYGNKALSGEEVPEFFEPMNEPFVHATDGIFKPATGDQMKTLMVEMFREVGKAIDANPRLANMKVIGYASAYPAMELKNFDHWEDNMKRFIDGAGDYMDGISIHLYDGINIRGKQSRRSGSNSEAILDLTETYTAMRYGRPKPLAISEYGGIDDTESDTYSEIINSRTVGAINHILFNLLERQDNMLISIPFLVDKAEWHLTEANNWIPYGPATFLPTDPKNPKTTTWYLSDKAKFYELWKGVEGARFDAHSSNPDIQVQGFRNGNKIYLAIDNLDDYKQNVDLKSSVDWSKFSNVKVRSLVSDYDNGISYEERAFNPQTEELVLDKQNTVILIADVNEAFSSNSVTRQKYYAPNYLEQIAPNKNISFTFSDVETGSGRAVARMSIARKLSMSKKPVFKVNGVEVEVPDNWGGYDQTGRDDFFGTIEIPFSLSLLKDGQNELSFTFSDNGGQVACVVLETEKYKEPIYSFNAELVNGDFELGSAKGWIPWAVGGRVIVADQDGAKGKAASLEGMCGLSQVLALEPSAQYELSFVAKDADKALTYGVETNDNISEVSGASASVKYSFRTDEDGQTRLFFDIKNTQGIAWIDDVMISKIP